MVLYRQEEVGDSSSQVEQSITSQLLHRPAHAAQHVQVVVDGDEGQHQEQVLALDLAIPSQDLEHEPVVLAADRDLPRLRIQVQEVEEAVRLMAVVPAVRLQAELPVQEDDSVAGRDEILGAGLGCLC